NLPRLNGNAKFDTFKGTLNFLDAHAQTSAGGLVNSATTLGSDTIDFGILGEPANPMTRIFDFECANNVVGDFRLGAIRVPSANALVYVKLPSVLNIGALNRTSLLNSTFQVRDAVNGTLVAHKVKLVHGGSGSLVLGESFRILAESTGKVPTGDYRPAIEILSGTLDNAADLSEYSVSIADGVALKGDVSSLAASVLPKSYSLVLPEGELDKTRSSTLLTVAESSAEPTLPSLEALNKGETRGLWRIRKVTSNGKTSYVLKWCSFGFAVVIR
ncbi:MAG: hypothetical protein ACI4TC_06320, partial [Kiritimatiellia bacterium]